MHYIVLSS